MTKPEPPRCAACKVSKLSPTGCWHYVGVHRVCPTCAQRVRRGGKLWETAEVRRSRRAIQRQNVRKLTKRMTIREAAELLKISKSQVHRLLQENAA